MGNKIRIYHLLGNIHAQYGIIEQLFNNKDTFVTVVNQGDGSFWFTEDDPDIDINEWFPSLVDAETYLKNYTNSELVFMTEDLTILNWK